MIASNQNLRGYNWIKGFTVFHSNVTMSSSYSVFQGHTSRERRRWDSNPEFGFLYMPTGMSCKVKELKQTCFHHCYTLGSLETVRPPQKPQLVLRNPSSLHQSGEHQFLCCVGTRPPRRVC